MSKDNLIIRVSMWNNDLQEYVNCGSLIYDNIDRIGFLGFVYDLDYIQAGHPAIDPAHLKTDENFGRFVHRKMDGTVFPYFKEFVPGEFGNQLLLSVNPKWAKLSQAERLYIMTKAWGDYGAAQLNAQNDQNNSPIKDLNELSELVKAIREYQEGRRSNVLTGEIQGALCSLKGIRPKVDYEERRDKVARRMIAKLNFSGLYNDARVSSAMTRMQKACEIDAVDNQVKPLECGEDVLLSRNYARTEYYAPDQGHTNKLILKYNRMSMRRLLEDDPNLGNVDRLNLSHVIYCLNKYSSDPETDKEEAFRRAFFDLATNHTSNGLDNWEMYDSGSGHWRLSPSYSNLPNPYLAAEFDLSFGDGRSAKFLMSIDENLVNELGEICEIDNSKALGVASSVVNTVCNFKKYAGLVQMSEADQALVGKALQMSKLKALQASLNENPVVKQFQAERSLVPEVEEMQVQEINVTGPSGPSM